MAFEDIAIVDLELAKTSWSRVHSAMRTLYLRLSREPEIGWVRFFHEERESRVVIKRHGFWIEENYIVFDCLLEDVERFHLPDFRLSLEYANRAYRAWLEEQFEQGLLQREDARNERDELTAIRERIRLEAAAADAPPAPALPQRLAAAAAAVPSSQFAAPARGEQRVGVTLPEPPAAPVPEAPPPVERVAVTSPVRSHGLAARVAELLRHVGGTPPLSGAPVPRRRESAAPLLPAPPNDVGETNEARLAQEAPLAQDAPEPASPAPADRSETSPLEAAAVESPVTDPAQTELALSPPSERLSAVSPEAVSPESAAPELTAPELAAPELTAAETAAPEAQAPSAPSAVSPPGGDSIEAGFNAKREEWRARFRAALAAQSKERNRGND